MEAVLPRDASIKVFLAGMKQFNPQGEKPSIQSNMWGFLNNFLTGLENITSEILGSSSAIIWIHVGQKENHLPSILLALLCQCIQTVPSVYHCSMNSSSALCYPLYSTIILLYFVKSFHLFPLALFTFDMKLSLDKFKIILEKNKAI